MLTRWKALLSAVAVIGVGALAVVGWMVFAPASDPFSAEEMFHLGRVNTSAVTTYKFTTDARFTVHTEGGPEHQEFHTEATVVVDEGMHVTWTENGRYGETLLLDGAQYHRESDAGAWEEWSPPGSWPAAPNFPSPRDHFQILDGLTDVSHEGQEVLRGVRVNKVTGNVDTARQVREAWGDEVAGGGGDLRAQMLAGTVTVAAWVGAEDGLLHAYTMEGSFPAVGEAFAYQYSMETRFSHFNEPLELPSPNAVR
ncbi:MAG: hypothetical protein OXL37_11125 [Chloroflexota bacterium]|nr:hypothetical protein [Chloroflexota bacterium]MDE2959509.1 hypothetical protein [Chloroflexota bacterium]